MAVCSNCALQGANIKEVDGKHGEAPPFVGSIACESSKDISSHIVSSGCWTEILDGDLLELRMRVEEGHIVIQFQERVF